MIVNELTPGGDPLADPLTDDDYARRAVAFTRLANDLIAWLHHEGEQRVRNRSFGHQEVVLFWDDGMPNGMKVSSVHTVKRDGESRLPSPPVDKPDSRR